MQREILFRGKRLDNGEWVEGYYMWSMGKSYITHVHCVMPSLSDPGGEYFENTHEIVPETVGQFTGLPDKNRNKIFDGDILKIQLPMGGFWGNVKTEKIGAVNYEKNYGAYEVRWQYSKNQHHVILNCDVAIEAEIISSIHDNPELLKT